MACALEIPQRRYCNRARCQAVSNSATDWFNFGGMIDAALMQQVKFDFESLKRATGRTFTAEETDRYFAVQQQATRWTFHGPGMGHKNFLGTTELLNPGSAARLEGIVPMFC
jgi:hypothetical protein